MIKKYALAALIYGPIIAILLWSILTRISVH
jgi:hypothetical protein